MPMPEPELRLGLPIWGFDGWRGAFYTEDAKPRDFLAQYAEVFSAVEGNSTFYSPPPPTAVERWRDATPETFRFCFKLPRTVTHERGLRGPAARAETEMLLERLAPLGPRQGPYLVQLPAAFGPAQLVDLERFLAGWPPELDIAVEVRHRAFFPAEDDDPSRSDLSGGVWPDCSWTDGRDDGTDAPRALDQLLARHGAGRVVMHTGAMRAGDLDHPDIVNARHEKPDLPIDPRRVARAPVDVVVRFVGHPDPPGNEPFVDEWARILDAWIEAGRRPFFFVHTPNNVHAPALARSVYERLAARRELPPLPSWPVEGSPAHRQLSLL